jgi:CubicO group peptidase (beta-lactamase class C family)
MMCSGFRISMRRRFGLRLAVSTIAAAALACGDSRTGPSGPSNRELTPVAATSDWPSATPESQGMDAISLLDLVRRIDRREYGSVTSLVIARNAQLVVEEYFGNWTGDRPHTMQSVTKSVTSLLAGLAVDRGQLAVTDRVVDFFPDYAPVANLDHRKRAMTVRDLLMMQTGLDWSETPYTGSPLQRLNTCGCDWLRLVLDWPMREAPGTRWEYNSGGVITLGGLIGRATGQRVDLWAATELFGPLEIRAVSWFSGLPDGLPHTGGGLDLRPRDAAKIGQLVLDNGRWRGREIVSAAWIGESTLPRLTGIGRFGPYPADYGYLWWRLPGGVITASGARGQWIFVVPDRNLVVATTAEADGDFLAGADFLYNHVLPAAR